MNSPSVWIDNETGAPFPGQESQIERDRLEALEQAVIETAVEHVAWLRRENLFHKLEDCQEVVDAVDSLLAAREKR